MEQLGSWSKVSVSDPEFREKEPDLAFKAPTYTFKDSSFLSTRQGGFKNLEYSGLFLIFLVLTVNSVRKIKAVLLKKLFNGVTILRKRIIINMTSRAYNPVNPGREPGRMFLSTRANNIIINSIFLKILLFLKDFNGVYKIDSKKLRYRLILPSD